jgi:methyltransferase family protein
MLSDAKEIAIAANAKQKNIRDPRRNRQPFFDIFEDFFANTPLTGRYVDLGPGQFDFGEIVRERGGTCVGVDFDPAVAELGRYKGFEVVEMNIQTLPAHDFGGKFDGVFNKFSLNAFWHWDDDEAHRAFVAAIANLIQPEGWAWIGPWNGVPKKAELDDAAIDRVLDLQRELFEEHGFTTVPLTPAGTTRYGIHGQVANNVVFCKNLTPPSAGHPAIDSGMRRNG